MNFDLIKDRIHPSWHKYLQPFIESKECDIISENIRNRRLRGIKIAPLPADVFKCFEKCDYNDLKVVLMGFCPYHTFTNGLPVADGLCMSCSKTGYLQPSLEQFYWAIKNSYKDSNELNLKKNPDLTYLSEQGVLMCNVSLTTELNKAGSDVELWKPFTKYLIEEVFNRNNNDLIYVFLGKIAGEYEYLVNSFNNYSKTVQHPAAASYTKTHWNYSNVFKWIDKILMDNNKSRIVWDDNLQK